MLSSAGLSAAQQRSFLARKLFAAMATPIALLLLLGGLLGRQLLEMAEDASRVDHTDRVLVATNKTLIQILDQETSVRGYLLSGDRAFLEPYERAQPLEGFARVQQLTADNPGQQQRFDEAKQRYLSWLSLAEQPVKDGDLASMRALEAVRERNRRMDAAREAIERAVDVEVGLRTARAAASEQSTRTTKIVFVVLLGVSALLLAFLSRRQLGSIAATFGEALSAETRAREATEDEAWVRAGHAKLAGAMQGELGVAELGTTCLTALADYTSADVGAFFIKEGVNWRRSAGHALDSRAEGHETFADGEGVVGRAAREGTVLDLRDIPADFLAVRSGTGEATPREVVVIPARLDGVTEAVVELGFLKSADDRVRELLGRVGETIAYAVKSSVYKQQLRAFLDETQRQAEELQTQQEELRVQNEELEEQRKALQESKSNLMNQQAELEQINSHLEEQTHALEQQRDDLSRTQTELQRTNDYKSEFLANMSHELRTPLNSTLILAKLLVDNREGNLNAEQIKFAQTIYSAGNDLLALINDILDLSKIEAGKLDVRIENVVVGKFVESVMDGFQPVALDKGLGLSAEIEDDVAQTIQTDPGRVQQILKNLLSNALKFTEQGGVSLHVRAAPDLRLAFEVRDTGIGIPVDQQSLVFEAFKQADGTSNRKYGGTGLGLSISRDLARLLGGELHLDSAPGRGSTFTLLLPTLQPRAKADDERAALIPPVVRRVAKSGQQAPSIFDLTTGEVHDDRASLKSGERSLLIIEDDPQFARVLYELALELEFKGLIAHTAEEGLAMVARYRPSAIVLDVGLPDRSGLSVLDSLKHDLSTRHIPVHMVSGTDYSQAALEMGAAGYAIKPVKREQLIDAIKRLELKFTQKQRRVLVVEDDAVLRESTCRLLAADDVETVAVGTAKEALARLGDTTFDCMVLDLSLPDRTGFDLLAEMSAQENVGFPPVIVYTGRSLSREEEQTLRRHSQSIIVKGARSPERLLDEVSLFLHQIESELPPERQRMLRDALHREAVFEGKRVLVVEDDVRNIFALSSVLEPKGATVEIARNGREALAHLKNKPGVDLVLMDIMMPEMDGLECTREIRKQPALAKLPIIALTAKAMADDRDKCLAAGANDYIAKPLDVDKLLSLARVWMPK